MPDPTSGIIDNYGVRWNWGTETLEMNTGDETWVPVPGTQGLPGGNDTEIQYNDSGAFGATAKFTYDPTSSLLTLKALAAGTGSELQIKALDNSHVFDFYTDNSQGFLFATGAAMQVLVADNGSNTPAASAILQANSVTHGFLPPRMTTTQRDAIATPAEGLVIYNTTDHKLNVYTTEWEEITSAA